MALLPKPQKIKNMSFRFSSFSIMLIIFTITGTLPANAQYVKADKVLTARQPVTISVPEADTLIITYRPGSNIAEIQKVAVTDKSYEWTPKEAGLVSLSTPDGPAQTVSVRFSTFPFQGLTVMIIAGGILFGGAVFASVNLFGKTSAEMLTDRPDT